MRFANRSTVTGERIARKTNQRGFTNHGNPPDVTGEDLANSLNNSGRTNFPDPTIVTPEQIAIALGGPTSSLYHEMVR